MKINNKIWNRFTTVWAIEDSYSEFFKFTEEIESYKIRCKKILNAGLVISIFNFSFVILSLLFSLFSITNIFFFSQSLGIYYFIESGLEIFLLLFSLPFITIVIIFLLQIWRFFSVLFNRVQTIEKFWTNQTTIESQSNNNFENSKNPMDLNFMLLGEMEEYMNQINKHIYLSIFSLLTASILLLIPSIQHLGLLTAINGNIIFTILIPILLFFITLFYIPFLLELSHFIKWQHQKYKIIHSIYTNPLPLSQSSASNSISRLKSYLDKYIVYNKKEKIKLISPLCIDNIQFDLGFISKNQSIFIKKCNRLVPTERDIDSFYSDIQKTFLIKRFNPKYVRAILLCDWSNEEGEIDENIEKLIFEKKILLKKGAGGKKAITHIQIFMDDGKMYSMFPLVPERYYG
jgi:hypothetical protein